LRCSFSPPLEIARSFIFPRIEECILRPVEFNHLLMGKPYEFRGEVANIVGMVLP